MVKSVVGQPQRATFFLDPQSLPGSTQTFVPSVSSWALFNPTSVGQIPHLELVSGNDICRVPCGQLKYPVLCIMGGDKRM